MIRTFLFDLGNVLAFFSHERMCEQMGALCDKAGEEVKERILDPGIMWKFERGETSARQFHREFEQTLDVEVDINKLYPANADIFELNEPMLEQARQLKSRGFRIVLLSNTSPWHVRWLQETSNVFELFDDFTLSYLAGALKPDEPIYRHALKRIRCEPGECFFTDDKPENIEAARSYGLRAEVFTETDAFCAQLTELTLPDEKR